MQEKAYIMGIVASADEANRAVNALTLVQNSIRSIVAENFPIFGCGFHRYDEGFYIIFIYSHDLARYIDVCVEAFDFAVPEGQRVDMCADCRYNGCSADPHTCGYWVVKTIQEAMEMDSE